MSEPEREAKPGPSSMPTVQATPETKRVAPFPSSLELEEQIVNTSRVVPVVTPQLKGLPGKAIVSIKPASAFVSRRNDLEKAADDMAARKAEAFSPAEPTHDLANGRDLPIRFWPKFSGTHEADVSILMRWPDDAMELRTVRVHGHARKLDEAPADSLGETRQPVGRNDDTEVPVADPTGVAPVHTATLDRLTAEATNAANSVATHQTNGLVGAETEVESYKRRPPEAPWWESLAELALSLTIAGVAAGLSKKIASSMSLSKYSEIGFADSVKEALKMGGKRAFLTRDGKPEADSSSSTKLAFFRTQFRTLAMFGDENVQLVERENRRLGHLLKSDPGLAIAKMQAVRDGMRGLTAYAEREQADQTRLQWMSLLGRAVNGMEFVKVNGELRQTTNLQHATPSTRGILRIRVEEGKVTKASIEGVSQAVADHLLKQVLLREPIPLLIEYRSGGGGSFYTRDEVGRVRTPFVREGEEDRHHDVQSSVDRILSKSLHEWGVNHIETDDDVKVIGQ